jgi:hypothetical protein
MSVAVETASVERGAVDQAAQADERFVFSVLAIVIGLEACGLIWLFG